MPPRVILSYQRCRPDLPASLPNLFTHRITHSKRRSQSFTRAGESGKETDIRIVKRRTQHHQFHSKRIPNVQFPAALLSRQRLGVGGRGKHLKSER